ncbi:MAG: riboflavin synthase [Thermoleophilaceae bacterium]
MFTGLVQDKARVAAVERNGDGVRLTVETQVEPIVRGDSVCINGVCLTAVETGGGRFTADVMEETLRRSSLATLGEGDHVNVEPALQANARLGGHIVQGHVDGLGEVTDEREEGFARIVRIAAQAELLRYVVEKGSIAVDGVSLTVSAVADDWFEVSLIPETLERTTLGEAAPGRAVNLEVDVVAKYVEKLVAR